MPMLAAYAHGRLPRNAARIGAVGAAVVAIANVLEDPLRQGWAFFALLGGLVALYVGSGSPVWPPVPFGLWHIGRAPLHPYHGI